MYSSGGAGDEDKGKVVPVLFTGHHAMKAYWGSGCIAPIIIIIITTTSTATLLELSLKSPQCCYIDFSCETRTVSLTAIAGMWISEVT
jgi:hypothetical protein